MQGHQTDDDPIANAHRNMILGEKDAWSPAETLRTSCSKLSETTVSTVDHGNDRRTYSTTNGTYTETTSASDTGPLLSRTSAIGIR